MRPELFRYYGLKFSLLKLIFLILALAIHSVSAADETQQKPQLLIKAASEKMLQALRENKHQIKQDPSIVYGLVDTILLPNFDFEKMSKLALGKNWRKANIDQKNRFIAEFRLLLIRTYATAMLEYTDEEIVFPAFREDLSKKKVIVKMEIIQIKGPSIPMSLSMYQNKQQDWKVYDVKIDGISLVTTYRSSFANKIRQKGMDNLIAELASKNQKVKL